MTDHSEPTGGQQGDHQAWLADRVQPGNWLDIALDEKLPPGITGWSLTLLHMQQVCFTPEIRKRITEGTITDDFFLWAAQLIQPHEGTSSVRLNEEVRGVPYVRTGRPIEKGEQVMLADLAGLEAFDLFDDELDCGHFTIFWTGINWVGAFDFRAGRAKCLDLIAKALRFLEATKLAISKELTEPAIDSLHTACELVAKARLILNHHPAHKWKSHGAVSSAINREGKLGNVDAAFLALFNRLSDDRSHAKYATGYDALAPSLENVSLVEAMATGLEESIRPKKPTGP